MELIDEILLNIEPYVKDSMAVSNSLYITLQHYEIQKKSTELAEYVPEDNEYYIKKFLIAKKTKGCTDRTLKYYNEESHKTLQRINSDDWFRPLYESSMNPVSSYTQKYKADMEHRAFVNSNKLP